MKRFGIVPKASLFSSDTADPSPTAVMLLPLVKDLIDWLEQRSIKAVLPPTIGPLLPDIDRDRVEELSLEGYSKLDLIVVLGGDGTMLSAARKVSIGKVPLLGVNLGNLGFLTAVTVNEIFASLEQFLSGELKAETRLRLKVSVKRNGREVFDCLVLNDAVLNKGALARIVNLQAAIDDRRLTDYRADGLIVSTPTGSTAYNLSAGGPIITPDVEAIILTPICPFTLANRPIVISGTAAVTITAGDGSEDLYLTCDGQEGAPLMSGDTVTINRGEPLQLIPSPFHDHFSILRTKLGWGVGHSDYETNDDPRPPSQTSSQ